MPAPDKTSVDLPIETFGGRVSQYDPQQLPHGASPFNQDVVFSDVSPDGGGLVATFGTRPGIGAGFYPDTVWSGPNPTVNYIKTFQDIAGVFHTLLLTSFGPTGPVTSPFAVLYDDSPSPIPPIDPVSTPLNTVQNSYCQSDTLLGQEWLAISDGNFGIDLPYHYDGTNVDRVSQSGPGAPPTIADEQATYPLSASPLGATQYSSAIDASPTGLTEVGNTVTITVTGGIQAVHDGFLNVGDTIVVTGAGVAFYNGTWQVSKILSNTQIQYICNVTGLAGSGGGTVQFLLATFQTNSAISSGMFVGRLIQITGVGVAGYNGVWVVRGIPSSNLTVAVIGSFGLAASGGGNLALAGNISVGLHNLSVSFLLRSGYITKPAPFASWTANGSRRALVGNIPIGPSNVVGRIIIATPAIISPATSGPFFYLPSAVMTPSLGTMPSMVIGDNVTTSYFVDFTDTILQNSTAASNLYNLLVLGECSNVCTYAYRTFWAGERNKIPNFINTDFDGGFNVGGGVGGGDVPLGWISDPVNGAGGAKQAVGYYGFGYAISGNGVGTIRGMITQPAYQDSLGVNILSVNTKISVRIRLIAGGTVAPPASVHIRIEVFSPSQGSLGIFSVAGNQLTYPAFGYQEFIGILMNAQASIPSDTILRVYMDGTPALGVLVGMDTIEPYPTNNPVNRTRLRVPYASNPESFDALTGLIDVDPGVGEAIRRCFNILDNKLYIVRDRSIFTTQDDGANEPSLWSLATVSDTVGTPSVNGVGIGESWAIIAHHDGVYIFWGSEPVKISQEIQPDWNTINWKYGYTIYVVVDNVRKRAHIGVPTGAATSPNVEFVLDYSQLASSEGSVSAQDIVAHPQAYYSTFQPTKLVAPGKARKWTIWNIKMNSAGMSLRSDGSFHLLRGNGVGNGKVYDMQPSNLNDDGAKINDMYQTYFFPTTEEETMMQLRSHRKQFGHLTGYSSGSGSLGFVAYGSQNQRGMFLSNLTLKNPDHWDWEKEVEFEAERVSLLIQSIGLNSWHRTSKLCPTLKTSIISPVRGTA